MENILKELKEAIVNCDEKAAVAAAKKAVEMGIDPIVAIEQGLAAGMQEVGDKYENGEFFLIHLIMAGEAMKAALKVLNIESQDLKKMKRGTVVIGTVRGDIHTIGKDVVASLLRANGFEVYDLGVDVPASRFLEAAEEVGADIIAASALMTTTLPQQRELIRFLEEKGVRNKFFVMIGGGATSKQWCEEIGADGWAENAPRAVKVAINLMEKRRK
ncbi:corrinoid protein [Candidatus Bathyarchaeota archaeon]|nr:corrinoid protein [Candidatus Bathyarchaeota archaeon]